MECILERGNFRSNGTAEISRLRGGRLRAGKTMRPERTMKSIGTFSAVRSGRILF
jgi:hypothetical protein